MVWYYKMNSTRKKVSLWFWGHCSGTCHNTEHSYSLTTQPQFPTSISTHMHYSTYMLLYTMYTCIYMYTTQSQRYTYMYILRKAGQHNNTTTERQTKHKLSETVIFKKKMLLHVWYTCTCTWVHTHIYIHVDRLYWSGKDAGSGVAQCVDNVLLDKSQCPGLVLLESSEVELWFLIVQLQGRVEKWWECNVMYIYACTLCVENVELHVYIVKHPATVKINAWVLEDVFKLFRRSVVRSSTD